MGCRIFQIDEANFSCDGLVIQGTRLSLLWAWYFLIVLLNTLRQRQNGCHFPDDIFKHISLNENMWISIKISLKFVHKGPIDNNPALVQIMAWHGTGDKPSSEPMMVRLLPHICVSRPQWVKFCTCHTEWYFFSFSYTTKKSLIY